MCVLIPRAASAQAQNPITPFAQPSPQYNITLPRDFGAHPNFRSEWWYITAWLTRQDNQQPLGAQITFFRSRTAVDPSHPSRLAASQILSAHAAVADPSNTAHPLLHDQRVGRAGSGAVHAATTDLNVRLQDWLLERLPDGRLRARINSQEFAMQLDFTLVQAPLLQGNNGFSRKGPSTEQSSHYVSLPHLKVTGLITLKGKEIAVQGTAWYDQEWSSTVLDPQAVGWDWVGANLHNGSALMAFQVRRTNSTSPVWAHAVIRQANGALTQYNPEQVRWTALQWWTSPQTNARYPVKRLLTLQETNGAQTQYELDPLIQAAELDSRASTGIVYWEGPIQIYQRATTRTLIGSGYLELTGYHKPLRF